MNSTLDLSSDAMAAARHGESDDCALIQLPRMSYWNNPNKSPEQQAHIKMRAQALQAGINLPYSRKISHARRVLKSLADYTPARWAISYSGGRDSTVLSHLALHTPGLGRFPHVMSNTRMEYPETIKMVNGWWRFLRSHGILCETVYPKERPKDLWPRIGVPVFSKIIAYKYRKFRASESDKIPSKVPKELHNTFRRMKAAGIKVTDECCDELKKKPLKAWQKRNGITGAITGVRCSESRNRRLAWIMQGAVYNATSKGTWIANPLAFWTSEDVARYLSENGLTVLSPDTVQGGSGCVTCMFGCQARAKEGTLNAMQELATLNPKMHRAALDEWGYRAVLDYLGIPYE